MDVLKEKLKALVSCLQVFPCFHVHLRSSCSSFCSFSIQVTSPYPSESSEPRAPLGFLWKFEKHIFHWVDPTRQLLHKKTKTLRNSPKCWTLKLHSYTFRYISYWSVTQSNVFSDGSVDTKRGFGVSRKRCRLKVMKTSNDLSTWWSVFIPRSIRLPSRISTTIPICFKIKSPCDRCLVSFSGEVKLPSTWLLKLSSRRTKGRPQKLTVDWNSVKMYPSLYYDWSKQCICMSLIEFDWVCIYSVRIWSCQKRASKRSIFFDVNL